MKREYEKGNSIGSECLVVAAHAGCGKTYAVQALGDRALDLLSAPFKFSHLGEAATEELEELKADSSWWEMQEEWQENYVNAIASEYRSGKWDYIFVAPERNVILELEERGISYVLSYPKPNLKEEYKQRYIQRGNSNDFLEEFIGNWNQWMCMLRLRNHASKIIELGPGEYLIDGLARCGLIRETGA